MAFPLQSPLTTNLTTSFPYHTKLKPHTLSSNKNSSQLSFAPPQQTPNEPFTISPLHKLPLSNITTFATTSTAAPSTSVSRENAHWMVVMDKPPGGIQSRGAVIDYYVATLQRAMGSDEKDAQRCIYDASCDTHFGFCCIVEGETSAVLASLPGVLSVKPDPDINSVIKDYSNSLDIEEKSMSKALDERSTLLFPNGWKHWLVRVEKPSARVSFKAQMVDLYVNMLSKVLGNEKDAQMCLYHVQWENYFGFCCMLDDDSAQELGAMPGVLSVQPDEHFDVQNKDYAGDTSDSPDSSETQISKTKLFITGLSFYTSEKTLRAAFEPFGELLNVKVIMDKISKRSKGYAFVEYTTEDSATTALQQMNGKIINGWMIVVDRAKSKPQFSRERTKAILR